MEANVIGPLQAFKEGWSLFRRNPLELLGGFVVFISLLGICAMMPVSGFIRWALLAVITFPLLGGLHILFLNAARNTAPQLTNLFCGFRQSWKWFSAGWVYAFLFNTFLVPCLLILLAVAILVSYSLPASSVLHVTHCTQMKVAALILAPVPAFLLFMQYAFMLFTTTDANSIGQSVKRSQQLVRGRHLRLSTTMLATVMSPYALLLIGYIVLVTGANAFGWPGWAMYALGAMVASVIALCAFTLTFVHLDQTVTRDSVSC